MKINSKEYWDKRFATDWQEFEGEKQTAFFAELLCQMLPNELIKEAMTNEYTICDMGCAQGDAVPIYSRKFGQDVVGIDFSEEAIKTASEHYPGYEFYVGNLLELDEEKKYDIVICSNVLEHFVMPWKILKNLTNIAEKYIIIMVPYREKLKIEEHEYHFSEEVIPLKIKDFTLDNVQTVDGKKIDPSYYPDQQILLIYKKTDDKIQMLNQLTSGILESVSRENEEILKNYECQKQRELELIKTEYAENIEKAEKKYIKALENIKASHIKELQDIQKKYNEKLDEKQTQIDIQENRNKELEVKYNELETQNRNTNVQLEDARKVIMAARTLCLKVNSKNSYRIMCTLARLMNQFILGTVSEKKAFLKICQNAVTGKKSEFTRNDGYNMILNVANLLDNSTKATVISEQSLSSSITVESVADDNLKESIIVPSNISSETMKCLKQKYNKTDIIILSVIDYDFRYQRPQHFASRFSENGHRVFYINANFWENEKVENKNEALYVVNFYNEECRAIYFAHECAKFQEWFVEQMTSLIKKYAISDAVIVLDYPNWIYGAEAIRNTFGFKLVIDYMDDFTGFLGTTTQELKENCIYMLKNSDAIIPSSQFLADIAQKYTSDVTIVRNGTEVDHFYKAKLMEKHKKRPVIGYYGAVSHWFAYDKVCYVAEHMPHCDVVIIGEVTDYRAELEKYNNIKLLGEMKYAELPEHLAYFDVCLIPFDTSTDLIKATNPVKFYEYLSAGKRVVATEIPELEPYRNEYVYMSNDNLQFLNYVKLCIEGKDTLKSKDECVAFAKENDWQKRYEAFAATCFECVPKVSIIVLTYNNCKLNKHCINSILDKTAYPNYELIILDNCSTDGTIEYLKELEQEKNPKIRIIFNTVNQGFAGGNNKAIEQATGDYIMLLNNDTVVTRGWLTNAVKHMENDQKCGMCGAVTNSIGNEAMISVNYKNLEELDSFSYQYTRMHNNEIYTNVDRLAMFCTLIRKDIMDKYGMLDVNYQVGMFEDDDYAKLVEKAGYDIYMAEDVFVHHVNNASFKKLQSEEYKKIFDKNKEYFEKKWNVKWQMPKYRDGVFATINEGMMIEPEL